MTSKNTGSDHDEYDDVPDEYCSCGARIASDGACENEDHDDSSD